MSLAGNTLVPCGGPLFFVSPWKHTSKRERKKIRKKRVFRTNVMRACQHHCLVLIEAGRGSMSKIPPLAGQWHPLLPTCLCFSSEGSYFHGTAKEDHTPLSSLRIKTSPFKRCQQGLSRVQAFHLLSISDCVLHFLLNPLCSLPSKSSVEASAENCLCYYSHGSPFGCSTWSIWKPGVFERTHESMKKALEEIF